EKVQLTGPAEVAELTELVQGVAGAELGHLRNSHHARLREMLVIPVAYAALDQIRRELPVRDGNSQQLGADNPLACPALVHVDVGALRADDGVNRPQQQAEPEDVGPGPVEHEEGSAGAERVP